MGTHPIFESDFDCLTEFVTMSTERTFIAIKPDGVQRGLVGKIIKRLEQRGFKLVAMKLCKPGKEHLETHYADLKSKPFFAGLVNYMNSGPICAMVWEGLNVVKMGRMMLGETNPQASLSRLDPRRLFHPGRTQHLPRVGRGRIRQPRDRPLVQTGRAHRL